MTQWRVCLFPRTRVSVSKHISYEQFNGPEHCRLLIFTYLRSSACRFQLIRRLHLIQRSCIERDYLASATCSCCPILSIGSESHSPCTQVLTTFGQQSDFHHMCAGQRRDILTYVKSPGRGLGRPKKGTVEKGNF